jgi:two-component system LytT family response regulator
MSKIKILIAEDESPARRKLVEFIKRTGTETELLEADDGLTAVENYSEFSPDIIFLDIQMPRLDGFEVLEQIGSDNLPVIIFATAYDEYAIKAFEVSAIDYLLKPFDFDRFNKAFQHALEQLSLKKNLRENISRLLKKRNIDKKYDNKILVNSGRKFFFVEVKDITYISSYEKYVLLHTEDGKYLLRETMQNMEEKLDKEKFARIHRSYIVNIEIIKEMQPVTHGDYIVLLTTGEKLNMSRRYRGNLFT